MSGSAAVCLREAGGPERPLVVAVEGPGAEAALRAADLMAGNGDAAALDRLLQTLCSSEGVDTAAAAARDAVLWRGGAFLAAQVLERLACPILTELLEALNTVPDDGALVVLDGQGLDRAGALGMDAAATQVALKSIAAEAPGRVSEGGFDAEAVWDTLGPPARLASQLRQRQRLKAAVLTFKGRGRVIGPIDPDRLLRHGVSEWR